MRAKVFSGFAALALIAAGSAPARAAPQCMQAAERTAFDVRAMQSQLMIAALTCGQQDEYNTFVQRHQSDISGAYQQIASHFGRIYGPAGQQHLDEYITELANAQSQEGIRQGPFFCRNVKPLFSEALTLQSANEIASFATKKNLVNPYSLATCVPPAVSVTQSKTNRELNAPAPTSAVEPLTGAGPATEEPERGGRDTEMLRAEAELNEATRASELLRQKIAALESSLSHQRRRR